MAADVAHELRTPLAALQAGLEEVRDGLVSVEGSTLARLHDQSLRLGRIVEDLAELSSAEAATLSMQLSPVDLGEVVAAEVEARQAQLRAAGLIIHRELATACVVDADPARLHQIVGNLLQNCARHCRPGDKVNVRVECIDAVDKQSGSVVRMTVTDTGPGIAPEDLPRVFTRFWRAPAAHGWAEAGSEDPGEPAVTATPGSGLGLAVVQSLIHAHRGTISVTSVERHGTTVTVDLPAATQPVTRRWPLARI
jgi:two-component system sensor histidine kinase BaeS